MFQTGLFERYNRYKCSNHFKKIRNKMLVDGISAPPYKATLELTMRCNLLCTMCFRHKKDGELELPELKKVIDNLGNIKEISLIGGEIFLRKDIYDILDYLKEKGLKVNLHTNGTLIDEAVAEKLERYDNFGRIGFSIDGLKDLHNEIRGSNTAFDKTVNAIRLMSSRGVSINTVVNERNMGQLQRLFQLAKELGVEEYRIEPEMFSTSEEIESSKRMLRLNGTEVITLIREGGNYALKG